MSKPAISVRGLGKRYRIGARTARYKTLREAVTRTASHAGRTLAAPFRRAGGSGRRADNFIWALKDVCLDVSHGEVLGLVGRNGAGKSTLLKILSRVTEPTEGHADIRGRLGSLLEVGTGFHSELSGRENIYLNGAILGMRRAEIDSKFDEIVAFAEVEKFLDTPVKRYSSGMYLRLAFAVAAHLETQILLVDEVLAVGDASFQAKCLGKIDNLAREGRTVLFVSHNLEAVRRLCTSACLIGQGQILAVGAPGEIIASYLGRESTAGRVEVNDDAGHELRIRRVSLLQDGANAGEYLDYGSAFDVAIEYDVLAPVRNVLLGFDVVASSGAHLFRTYDVAAWGSGTREPGSYRSQCRIPGGLLQPGGYFVQILAAIHREKWISRNRVSLRFELGGAKPSDITYPGVLCAQGEWSVEPRQGLR